MPPRLFVAGEFLPPMDSEEENEIYDERDDDFLQTETQTETHTDGVVTPDKLSGTSGLSFSTPGRRRLAALLKRSDASNWNGKSGGESSMQPHVPRYGVLTYSMDGVRKGKDEMCIPESRLDGHVDVITSMSYGPYNNGPLTTMCEGGFIKVWGGGIDRRSPTNLTDFPETFTTLNDIQDALDQCPLVEPTQVLRYGTSKAPISIYTSAVQPNDHVWTAGQGHLKAWPLA